MRYFHWSQRPDIVPAEAFDYPVRNGMESFRLALITGQQIYSLKSEEKKLS